MDIVITGSVAFDYLMTFPGKFKEHILPEKLESISLSFLVTSLVRRRGGIAPNIAYNLALLGGNPRIFATVGTDFEEYRQWLEAQGVDTTYAVVIENELTGSFFATTDEDNAQMASFYPGAMGHAATLSLKDLAQQPDLVVISPTDPAAMDKYIAECKQMGISYIYDPSQQIVRVDGDTLRNGIDGATALFVNEYEFELVRKMTGMSAAEILEKVELIVVTLGSKGVQVYHADEKLEVPSVLPQQIIDPTGAGDAFRGGFLTGFSRGWDFKTCARMGALSATYCLESDGPQGQAYTKEEYITRFRQQFDDGGLLDELINQ
ncbi:MAG: carbohydrate kinase family protein [Anaerolineales bacterium]|nr:carbohydrate kinase family protein [Anaerolineales bacterium]